MKPQLQHPCCSFLPALGTSASLQRWQHLAILAWPSLQGEISDVRAAERQQQSQIYSSLTSLMPIHRQLCSGTAGADSHGSQHRCSLAGLGFFSCFSDAFSIWRAPEGGWAETIKQKIFHSRAKPPGKKQLPLLPPWFNFLLNLEM